MKTEKTTARGSAGFIGREILKSKVQFSRQSNFPFQKCLLSNFENFHDFVAEVVDDFDCDAAIFRRRERARRVAAERRPRIRVNFRLQRFSQRFVRIFLSEKIRLPHEKAFRVVIRIDKPARDSLRPATDDLPFVRDKTVTLTSTYL